MSGELIVIIPNNGTEIFGWLDYIDSTVIAFTEESSGIYRRMKQNDVFTWYVVCEQCRLPHCECE